MLTGLGTQSFEDAIEAVFIIHAIFACQFPENAMEEWKPSSYMDHRTIAISNRYFSEMRFCPGVAPVPFHPSVDPKGILQGMTGDRLIHSQENHVDYYEWNSYGSGQQE
jgi:hypothetical protein